jgi:hypothetical protein
MKIQELQKWFRNGQVKNLPNILSFEVWGRIFGYKILTKKEQAELKKLRKNNLVN